MKWVEVATEPAAIARVLGELAVEQILQARDEELLELRSTAARTSAPPVINLPGALPRLLGGELQLHT